MAGKCILGCGENVPPARRLEHYYYSGALCQERGNWIPSIGKGSSVDSVVNKMLGRKEAAKLCKKVYISRMFGYVVLWPRYLLRHDAIDAAVAMKKDGFSPREISERLKIMASCT